MAKKICYKLIQQNLAENGASEVVLSADSLIIDDLLTSTFNEEDMELMLKLMDLRNESSSIIFCSL